MYLHGMNITPNLVMEGSQEEIRFGSRAYKGFYVSYNCVDRRVYGADTTALVLGQMQKFYILNGDHRAEYSKLIGQGFQKCLEYFRAHIAEANKHSEENMICLLRKEFVK